MSWTDEKETKNLHQTNKDTKDSKNDLLTDSQKIELIAQTVDQLVTENDLLNFDMRENLQNSQDLQKETYQMLNQLSQRISTLDQSSKHYEKQVLGIVRWKTLAKQFLELLLYLGAIVLLVHALTTSLWQTIGLKALYEHFNGQKNIQLGLTIAYIAIVLGLFVWILRKVVKSSRYY